MLVLTRRFGESILIGEEIEVAVLGLTPNQVRLGIRAPAAVPVVREELLRLRTRRIQRRRGKPA